MGTKLGRFKQNQAVVTQVLERALTQHQLSHAYLLSGAKGSGIDEMALFLAQTLVCEHGNPWACEECDSCMRIEKGIYADMLVLDGREQSIKKEHVLSVIDAMTQTALERYGVKLYLVYHADNSTPEAMNSLLKTLEEPSSQKQFAILTSESPEKLLPTIVSRCQHLQFKHQIKDYTALEIDLNLDSYEKEILNRLSSDEAMYLRFGQDPLFDEAIHQVAYFFEQYTQNDYLGEIYLQNNLLKGRDVKLNREYLTLFLNIAMLVLRDCLTGFRISSESWAKRCAVLHPKLKKVSSFEAMNEAINAIESNANPSLVIDRLLYQIKEGV